jgi:hypothetical protein
MAGIDVQIRLKQPGSGAGLASEYVAAAPSGNARVLRNFPEPFVISTGAFHTEQLIGGIFRRYFLPERALGRVPRFAAGS